MAVRRCDQYSKNLTKSQKNLRRVENFIYFRSVFFYNERHGKQKHDALRRQRRLFEQPRKAASGFVFSGAVFGMLVLSILLSVTLALISQTSGTPVSELTQSEAYLYVAYVLYDVAYIAAIASFLLVCKEKPRALGFRLPKARYWPAAVLLAFGLLFSLNFVNGWFIDLLGIFGYEASSSALPSVEGAGLFGVLFAVAVLPAFFEETLLRGVVLEGIKDVGTVAACLLGGLLFSLFHMSPAQTVYQFVCGCAFTLLAIRAQSVFPTMLAHFLNNAVIVLDLRFGFLAGVTGGAAAALYAVSASVSSPCSSGSSSSTAARTAGRRDRSVPSCCRRPSASGCARSCGSSTLRRG